jgi:hypothetical protein
MQFVGADLQVGLLCGDLRNQADLKVGLYELQASTNCNSEPDWELGVGS